MIAIDTSVTVAAFASWHEFHDAAAAVLDRRPQLPGHVALETYSVLTRLPPPHRASPALVLGFLEANFESPYLTLSGDHLTALMGELAKAGITGGATYDGLIAAVAREVGATLLTCDLRAKRTYDLIGTAVEFVG